MKQYLFSLVVSLSVFLFTFVCKSPVYASFAGVDKLTLSGFLKNATSVNLDDLDEFLKIRSTVQLSAEYRLTENIHFFTIFRGWYDSVYDTEATFRKRKYNRKHMSRTKDTDWLRECYIDFYSEYRIKVICVFSGNLHFQLVYYTFKKPPNALFKRLRAVCHICADEGTRTPTS